MMWVVLICSTISIGYRIESLDITFDKMIVKSDRKLFCNSIVVSRIRQRKTIPVDGVCEYIVSKMPNSFSRYWSWRETRGWGGGYDPPCPFNFKHIIREFRQITSYHMYVIGPRPSGRQGEEVVKVEDYARGKRW